MNFLFFFFFKPYFSYLNRKHYIFFTTFDKRIPTICGAVYLYTFNLILLIILFLFFNNKNCYFIIHCYIFMKYIVINYKRKNCNVFYFFFKTSLIFVTGLIKNRHTPNIKKKKRGNYPQYIYLFIISVSLFCCCFVVTHL